MKPRKIRTITSERGRTESTRRWHWPLSCSIAYPVSHRAWLAQRWTGIPRSHHIVRNGDCRLVPNPAASTHSMTTTFCRCSHSFKVPRSDHSLESWCPCHTKWPTYPNVPNRCPTTSRTTQMSKGVISTGNHQHDKSRKIALRGYGGGT